MKSINTVKTAQSICYLWKNQKSYQAYLTREHLTMYQWLIKELEPEKEQEADLYNHLLTRLEETGKKLKNIREEINEITYYDFLDEVTNGEARRKVEQLKTQYVTLKKSFKDLNQFYKENGFTNSFKTPPLFEDEYNAVMGLRV